MGVHIAKQYWAAIVVNVYMLVYGIFNAWIDIEYQTYFERLQYVENFNWAEHETNSFRELCLFFIGPIVGSIFFGYVAMKFGRRASLIYMAIPMILSCLLNVFVREFIFFKLSIVLGGIFGGAVFIVGPIYLMEIFTDRFRGAILTSLAVSSCLGEMLAFSEKTFLKDDIFSLWSRIPLSAIAAILIYRYLPDTPLSLIKRKELVEVDESIRFYKNIRKTDKHQMETFQQELDRVKNVAADGDVEANQTNSLQWADFKTKHARRALVIGMVLGALNVCTSNSKMAIQSALSLSENSTKISFEGSRFIVSVIALMGAYTSMQLVDRVGRKVLITVSGVVTSLALIGHLAHMVLMRSTHNQRFLDSIPAITLLMAIFFGALGIRSLTFTISTEIVPEKIKDTGVIFCGAFFWTVSYIFHATFYFMADAQTILFMAIACLAGTIVIYWMLPETRQKSRQEIMRSFNC